VKVQGVGGHDPIAGREQLVELRPVDARELLPICRDAPRAIPRGPSGAGSPPQGRGCRLRRKSRRATSRPPEKSGAPLLGPGGRSDAARAWDRVLSSPWGGGTLTRPVTSVTHHRHRLPPGADDGRVTTKDSRRRSKELHDGESGPRTRWTGSTRLTASSAAEA
jgi:hypothetical protein